MGASATSQTVATQGRDQYAEVISKGLSTVVDAVKAYALVLLDVPAEPPVVLARHDLNAKLRLAAGVWVQAMQDALRACVASSGPAHREVAPEVPSEQAQALTLLDDVEIDREILASRLAMVIMDRCAWEFTDLSSRMTHLEAKAELDASDVIRPQVWARMVIKAWGDVGFSLDDWRALQDPILAEMAVLCHEAYHEVNRRLVALGVLPEIDLRPFIRRAASVESNAAVAAEAITTLHGSSGGGESILSVHGVSEETRLLTAMPPLPRADAGESLLARLNRVVSQQLPDFQATKGVAAAAPASGLVEAIGQAQQGLQDQMTDAALSTASPESLLQALQERKAALKQAATTPSERATIEIVALMFQNIFTEERIPASVRVWFARLQMPVLRLAVTERDFFATTDHPARRLIDRMGACVMGFDTGVSHSDDGLEREIKRIVQVIEAYPDTGRRVFQTVLTEFEGFLENYFRDQNQATRLGVSLAQQVEQRETVAIQYTIELRRMLDEVPVQDVVRDFLFRTWADVVAVTTVKTGTQSEESKAMKRAAADLVWSSSAKVNREERAEVLRRLPALLKTLRSGMQQTGMDDAAQDRALQDLNNSLAAAFSAKTASIAPERLRALMDGLETLEEMMPDASEVEIDESMVLDLSGYESRDLEVVAEGGSMATHAMLAWAGELQVGGWYKLDYRNRIEPVQLAWRGLRKELTLFVSSQGRGILFQKRRLAAFLQAGLIIPAQEESLTVQATRSALVKIDADPSRLLG
jgi:hypothetical protein